MTREPHRKLRQSPTGPLLKQRLDAVVRTRFELSWQKARDAIATGKIWSAGAALTDPALSVEADIEIELRMNAPRPRAGQSPTQKSVGLASGQTSPAYARADILIFTDTQIAVTHKPAGLNTVPYLAEPEPALDQLTAHWLKTPRLHVVQRLDRETSGLVVFARTPGAAHHLGQQFRFHTVDRRYFALVEGHARSQTIRSDLVEDRGDGLRGSQSHGRRSPDAKTAVTHVEVLAQWENASLIECRLETGRTHQIRIHLSEAGNPLLGERAYIREYTAPRTPAARLMLHAAELGFEHPTQNRRVRWTQLPPPEFLAALPSGLRARLERELALRLDPA